MCVVSVAFSIHLKAIRPERAFFCAIHLKLSFLSARIFFINKNTTKNDGRCVKIEVAKNPSVEIPLFSLSRSWPWTASRKFNGCRHRHRHRVARFPMKRDEISSPTGKEILFNDSNYLHFQCLCIFFSHFCSFVHLVTCLWPVPLIII